MKQLTLIKHVFYRIEDGAAPEPARRADPGEPCAHAAAAPRAAAGEADVRREGDGSVRPRAGAVPQRPTYIHIQIHIHITTKHIMMIIIITPQRPRRGAGGLRLRRERLGRAARTRRECRGGPRPLLGLSARPPGALPVARRAAPGRRAHSML